MRFGDYLQREAIRPIDAARALGCSKGYVSGLLAGASDPSMDFARRVAAWSGGAVTPNDWPEPARRAA